MSSVAPLLLSALSAQVQAAEPPLKPGTYALQMAVFTRANVVVLGDVETTTHQLLLVTVEDRQGTLWQTQSLCDIRIDSDSRVGRPSIPSTFHATIPDRELAIALSPKGGAESPDGWRYVVTIGAHRSGWDPTLASAMPEDADHPAVVDSDRDGNPGVTIQLEVPLFGVVDLYVAQDVVTRLSGTLTADGAAGFVELDKLEQTALGASNALFATTPRAIPITTLSPFSLTPVDPASTCEVLKARFW